MDRHGRLRVIVEERNGEKNGRVTHYAADGTVRLKGRYVHDVQEGWWTGTESAGALRSLEHFEQGMKEGVQCYWGPMGRITRVSSFIHGRPDGALIDFLQDGRPALWTHKWNGKAHGPHYHWWFKDGRTTSVLMGTFHNDVYEGRWMEADTTGHLFWLADYDHGRLVRTLVERKKGR
jgi:antitoxin component YwqK of YwqJK toxin-antitoxin module